MWDVPGITHRQILANRPDTALHENKEKTCLLIYLAITNEPKFNKKNLEN
jgi:hypothetical protein